LVYNSEKVKQVKIVDSEQKQHGLLRNKINAHHYSSLGNKGAATIDLHKERTQLIKKYRLLQNNQYPN
jgi:hypothetical protein